MRTIDPEHNWYFLEGYTDAIMGTLPIPPDQARNQRDRSDYFAGYDAGVEERDDEDVE